MISYLVSWRRVWTWRNRLHFLIPQTSYSALWSAAQNERGPFTTTLMEVGQEELKKSYSYSNTSKFLISFATFHLIVGNTTLARLYLAFVSSFSSPRGDICLETKSIFSLFSPSLEKLNFKFGWERNTPENETWTRECNYNRTRIFHWA